MTTLHKSYHGETDRLRKLKIVSAMTIFLQVLQPSQANDDIVTEQLVQLKNCFVELPKVLEERRTVASLIATMIATWPHLLSLSQLIDVSAVSIREAVLEHSFISVSNLSTKPRRAIKKNLSLTAIDSPPVKESSKNANELEGSRRFLSSTPSFASSQQQYVEDGHGVISGMAELKQRVADLEMVSAQQSDMITLAIKDLYRFCQDACERQVSHTEYIVTESMQEMHRRYDHLLHAQNPTSFIDGENNKLDGN